MEMSNWEIYEFLEKRWQAIYNTLLTLGQIEALENLRGTIDKQNHIVEIMVETSYHPFEFNDYELRSIHEMKIDFSFKEIVCIRYYRNWKIRVIFKVV